jgi:flagellar motility protein MotE (MotC chaperone)
MIKLLSHPWLSAPVGVVVYLVATVLFWQRPTLPTVETGVPLPAIGPSWDFNNPEADELINELKAEKKALSTREKDLNELETRLQAERAELGQVTQSVRQLQNDFDKSVVRVKDEEVVNLKKLAKTYADMSPDAAANVLSQLNNEAMVRIFVFLKDKDAAGILEAMSKKGPAEARRAAEITEDLRLSSHNINTK